MAVILAIESSQRQGSVAVRLEDGSVLEEAIATAGYGDDLMASVSRVCAAAGVRPSQVNAVVVDRGPGGFTGLRVGVTTAKLLAEATGASLVGVPGAMVGAAGVADLRAPGAPDRVLAVLAVKRRGGSSTQAGTAWCALLERSGGRWTMRAPAGAGHMLALDDLTTCAARAGAQALLAERAHLEECADDLGRLGVPWLEPAWSARACLMVGQAALDDGQRDDPATLAPLYAREAEAVALWDQKRGRS